MKSVLLWATVGAIACAIAAPGLTPRAFAADQQSAPPATPKKTAAHPVAAAPHAAAAAAPSDFGAAHADAALGLDAVTPSRKVMDALAQMNMTTCAPVVERITDFLFEGQDANFVAQPLGPDNVHWPTVFTIESADPAGGHTRFAILMISGNCSGMYEQTIYWTQPCNTVRTLVFSKYTGDQALLRDYKVSIDGPARQVFLTAAGSGCVSIKKELFH